jgi:hypothetical protein
MGKERVGMRARRLARGGSGIAIPAFDSGEIAC